MNRVPWALLSVQGAIVIASLLGYGIFTSRPDLLALVDPQARFFSWAFHGFAVGNMFFGGLAVLADSLLRDRSRALQAFIAVYVLTLGSELLGTAFGVPFGPYSYTSLLGPKWFALVPLLIPLSWFTVGWAVWVIARRWTRGMFAVGIGTLLMLGWDLLLDPAMSRVTSYWVWGEQGSYYGMPWSNLAGWTITGFVLLSVINLLVPAPRTTQKFAVWVYLVNFLLPLGLCLLNGYWLAAIAGGGTVGAAWLLALAGGWRQQDSLSRESERDLPGDSRTA